MPVEYTTYTIKTVSNFSGAGSFPPSEQNSVKQYTLESARKNQSITIKTKVKNVNGKKWRSPTNWSANSSATIRSDGLQHRKRFVGGANGTEVSVKSGPYVGPVTGYQELVLGDIWNGKGFDRIHPNMRARLEVECMGKFDESKFHMASATVELGGTLSMLSHRTSPIWRSILAARRGRWGEIPHLMGFSKEARRDFLKDSKALLKNPRRWSDLYLEYKFGWDPLFSDISGLYEYATHSIQNSELLIEAVRTLQEDASSSSQNFLGIATRKATYKLFATVSSDSLRRASEVGLMDPLGIAWEGYPMSFVVDWLFPVGNLLQAAKARNGLTFKAGFVNRKDKLFYEQKVDADDGWQNTIPRLIVHNRTEFIRETVHRFPFPKPYLKSPFSTGTVVTGAALASQVYLRK